MKNAHKTLKQCLVSSKQPVNVSYYCLIGSQVGVNSSHPSFRRAALGDGQWKFGWERCSVDFLYLSEVTRKRTGLLKFKQSQYPSRKTMYFTDLYTSDISERKTKICWSPYLFVWRFSLPIGHSKTKGFLFSCTFSIVSPFLLMPLRRIFVFLMLKTRRD